MPNQVTQDLIDEVTRATTVKDGAKALLQALYAAVLNAPDLASAQKAVADLKASDDDLAQAVVDNTPAAPTTAAKAVK